MRWVSVSYTHLFCQILDFVKSQSTSFEKYNDTVVAKTLRRTAVSVHQLAQDPALAVSYTHLDVYKRQLLCLDDAA